MYQTPLGATARADRLRGNRSAGSFRPNRLQQKVAGGRDTFGRQRYWYFIHFLRCQCPEQVEVAPAAEETDDSGGKLRRLEAVLFLSPDGIGSRKLAKMAGLADATEARTLIRELNQQLESSGRAFTVEETAGGYTLLTRSQFAPWLRRLSHIPGELRLSQTALETLSVVAYRQPVLRANIEAIRGVGCSEVLKQLLEMDLVRISGRSEDLGRPYLYGTTSRFLQIFGLRSADRLPRIDWVNASMASLDSQPIEENGSDRKESSMTATVTTTVEETHPENEQLEIGNTPVAAIDDNDDDFYNDDEDTDWGDDEDDDEDVADGKTSDDEEDGEETEDVKEEDGGWQEVSDDDDGWNDDDDDEEKKDDDDWEGEEEEEDETWE